MTTPAAAPRPVPRFAVGDRVQITRGLFASMAGHVTDVRPDATGEPFYVVEGGGMPPEFLHESEIGPFVETLP